MAKLTDLPAELVISIIHYVFDANQASLRQQITPLTGHHYLDHTQINCAGEPKPRPHEERIRLFAKSYKVPQVYREQVSWPKGLPSNPLLPLALVNRTFRQCAQELLFKNVDLHNTRIANVFLKSLTACDYGLSSQRRKRFNHPTRLSQYVRSLQFTWGDSRLPGKLSATLFCKILQSCPLLENIDISNKFLLTCKESILEALASKPFIKEFVLSHDTNRTSLTFQWPPAEIVSRLFSHWNLLETVELSALSGCPHESNPSTQPAPNSIPVLNCAIRTMILVNHELDELTVSNLLKSCGESMRTLHITGPHTHLNPEAFGRVLQDSTCPNLECLIVHDTGRWEHWKNPIIDSDLDGPFTVPGLLDTVFDSPIALRKLKTLSFDGEKMATNRLLARLPKSLVKLSMENSRIAASALIKALTINSGHNDGLLPNLTCLSVYDPRKWSSKDEKAVQEVVELRGGCAHIYCDHKLFASPSPSNVAF